MGFISTLKRWIARLSGRRVLPPGIRIGADVHIGDASRFDWCHGRHITICDRAIIAPGVRILCHDASSRSRIGGTWVAPVTIEKGAFVGVEAVLMPGVTVGAGSIVAAGAVVTQDVPAGTVFAGIPARQIGLTVDLDARRREQMAAAPNFPSADYEGEDLTPDQRRQIEDAIANHGGYFLT